MGWFAEEPGGLNRVYAGLLNTLAAGGTSIRGLVAGRSVAACEVPASLSFFAGREIPTLRRLQACRHAVRDALRGQQQGVVAAHFSLYALPILDLLGGRRFVFHFHGPWSSESRAEHEGRLNVVVKKMIESCVYRRADRFITLSSAFAGILERQYGIRSDRIFVVPGGVDADRYNVSSSRREAREKLNLPLDRPLIVSVRRLIHRVGLEGLIDAMAEVRKSAPEALLLIAGRGALHTELLARAAARGLQDRVRFLGFVAEDDLPLLYRACDLSVVPSVSLEGFGLPTIESLAAGTPVLVTPIGGLPETVTALDPALVVSDCGSGALADALRRALRDLNGLPSAERCARYVREHFDWPVVARKVLAVYEQ
jgi:glycosyltransferase involved in cell wall biosynthesis